MLNNDAQRPDDSPCPQCGGYHEQGEGRFERAKRQARKWIESNGVEDVLAAIAGAFYGNQSLPDGGGHLTFDETLLPGLQDMLDRGGLDWTLKAIAAACLDRNIARSRHRSTRN